MELRQWTGVGDYDYFLIISNDELKQLFDESDIINRTSVTFNNLQFYYFINISRKVIAPLPELSLAFSGQYNGYPPYGKPLKFRNLNKKLYHFAYEQFESYDVCKKKIDFFSDFQFRFF